MNIDLLELIAEGYRHQGIQVLLLDKDYHGISQIDYGLRRKLTTDFDYSHIAEKMEQSIEENVQYIYTDDLRLTYCIFRFPQASKAARNCHILCIGPVLPQPVEKESILTWMKQKGIPSRFYSDFLEFYNRIPLAFPMKSWEHALSFLLGKLCGFAVPLRIVSTQSPELFSMEYKDYSIPDTLGVALHTIEERYRLEDEMLAAVAAGNLEQATRAHYHFTQYKLFPRTADPVRDLKNFMLTFNTLLRKTVQSSHVHPLHIDNLSREFAIQIESALTIGQLRQLSPTMLRKYCLLVNNYSRQSCSRLVQNCMDYIDFHYNEELSLGILAQNHAVSASYLSGLFKKETGMTVTDYINTTRIRQSLVLLNTTDLPVGIIASRCGFPDSSYFTRIFKKCQGKTPKDYRKSIHGQ